MSGIPYALKTGAVIAGYDIVRVLGAGGFGITYEAASAVTGKRVAIKEFFPRGIASRDSATRIIFDEKENEVVAWVLKRFESSTTDQCRLKHPNIVEVLHYVKDNGTGYMIMEYVEGQTLEHWLRDREKAPTSAELQAVTRPILDALHYLHGQSLIHRDIAPDNIMIRLDGKPMIIDFGALKLIEQQTQVRSKTNRSFAVSKQFYSPSEQMDGDSDLDARADIYSMGRRSIAHSQAARPRMPTTARRSSRARKTIRTFRCARLRHSPTP
ncbi:MAG TPA: serine/threonine-protein kinase [Xanthobacteraceae bacterium]|nr:serine/threonine-protein kinase [Xanthobacteraceae bacterium]